MSGIAAILMKKQRSINLNELYPMLAALQQRGPDGADAIHDGPIVLGCTRFDTLPEDGPQPAQFESVTVVSDARIDNREMLEKILNLSPRVSDATVIAAAVARWGDHAPEHLEGDFAVIAWNGTQLLAFRDRFGVRPLFYCEQPDRLILASGTDAMLQHPHVPHDLDPSYFIAHLATRRVITAQTPYRAIQRLERGHQLSCQREGLKTITCYYKLPLLTLNPSPSEAAETVRTILDHATKSCLRAKRVSCEVSGGLDSTSIYALASKYSPGLEARSLVSDRLPAIDERRYSRHLVGPAAWRKVNLDNLLSLADVSGAQLFDEPVQELVLGQARLALYDPAGHVQLSGHGGDALMTGRYGLIRGQVRSGHIIKALFTARTWGDARDRPMASILRYALRRSMIPRARFEWANRTVQRHAQDIVAHEWDRCCHIQDNPELALFQLYNETGLLAPLLPVELRYPFLDRKLVEYALALPPHLKSQGDIDKVVLRNAMIQHLPQTILLRKTKTAFDGLYAFSVYRNWSIIDGWLRRPILSELGVLSPTGLRSLAEELRDGQSGRLTEAMIALSAEIWLRGRTNLTPAHRQRQLAETNVPLRMGREEVRNHHAL
jgi:asparagine synthase (glutamine-hydrolysing)